MENTLVIVLGQNLSDLIPWEWGFVVFVTGVLDTCQYILIHFLLVLTVINQIIKSSVDISLKAVFLSINIRQRSLLFKLLVLNLILKSKKLKRKQLWDMIRVKWSRHSERLQCVKYFVLSYCRSFISQKIQLIFKLLYRYGNWDLE